MFRLDSYKLFLSNISIVFILSQLQHKNKEGKAYKLQKFSDKNNFNYNCSMIFQQNLVN